MPVGVLKRALPGRRRVTALDYTVRLSAALRVVNLTHALYDVLAAVARMEVEVGSATVAGVALRLCCSYENVKQHLARNRELFRIEEAFPARHVRLTAESLALMMRIKERSRRK